MCAHRVWYLTQYIDLTTVLMYVPMVWHLRGGARSRQQHKNNVHQCQGKAYISCDLWSVDGWAKYKFR